MTVYGYFRCSTTLQDEERQIIALKEAGVAEANIYGDKIGGTTAYGDRPELSKLLSEIDEGSLLILSEMNRLGRTMVEMLVEVNKLLEKGIEIKTLDKRLDTTTMPKTMVRLFVGVMGYAAEQELEGIKTRTAEGRAVAKNRGVKFGAKRKFDKYQIAEIMDKRNQGLGYGSIAKALGMNKSTVQMIVQREVAAA